ncbi:unnamed protein product [Rodentolepis nana]|uniref:SET domain-containing protein n=1 Tax=Rodentolepis nana TaxID=102285 RepID=A0A0R3TEY1_RODNA|nr:unnamed protein product [Rodentolepis nana]
MQAIVILVANHILMSQLCKNAYITPAFYRNQKPGIQDLPVIIPASWIAAWMLYHLKAVPLSSTPYVEYKGRSKKVTIAQSIYPTPTLIKHSCNPSVSLGNTANGGVFVYAVRSLRAGEETSITLGPHFAEMKANERKSFLKKHYRFDCSCEACCNEWLLREGEELIKCPSCQHLNISRANKLRG